LNKKLKNTLFIAGGLTAVALGISKLLHYLMAHRKADLGFIFREDPNPPAFEKELKEKRHADREWVLAQGLEEYTITSNDGLSLRGYLLKAKTITDKYVFCIHGYRMRGITEYDSIIRFYHDLGFNVFFIDHRCCGQSDGTYITYGDKEQEDCLLWISFMLKQFGPDIRIVLHGISLGSATTMLVLGHELPKNIKFAVCDCGYATVKGQLTHNFKQYKLPPQSFYQLYRFMSILEAGSDPEKVAPVTAIENCHLPVIFAHGIDDSFVPFEMVYAVFDACPSKDKKLVAVSGADHARAFFATDELKDTIKEYICSFM